MRELASCPLLAGVMLAVVVYLDLFISKSIVVVLYTYGGKGSSYLPALPPWLSNLCSLC